MKIPHLKKLIFIFSSIILLLFVSNVSFAIWRNAEDIGGIIWDDENGVEHRNGWFVIDEDGDGIGYKYYFDEFARVVIDDICPDYQITNDKGRLIDMDGNEVEVVSNVNKALEVYSNGEKSELIDDIMKSISETEYVYNGKKGLTSEGSIIVSAEGNEAKPSDDLKQVETVNGYILGKNVDLTKKKEEYFDNTMSRNCQEYIVDGKQYTKAVKEATIFTKTKWKGVTALKGDNSSVVYENPKNNFNFIKGRIAHIYTSSSDRTTECVLNIINADNNETLETVRGFDYNAGKTFEAHFPKKTNRIMFELLVTGATITRTCYLRDVTYGFDKEAYQDELYEDEIERDWQEKYGSLYANDDLVNNDDEEETYDDELGEIPLEDANAPKSKKSISTSSDTDDSVYGPAFDESLKNIEETVGPDGSAFRIAATED